MKSQRTALLRPLPTSLDEDEASELLDQTLQEEIETDEKLTTAAETVNAEANQADDESEEDEEEEKAIHNCQTPLTASFKPRIGEVAFNCHARRFVLYVGLSELVLSMPWALHIGLRRSPLDRWSYSQSGTLGLAQILSAA